MCVCCAHVCVCKCICLRACVRCVCVYACMNTCVHVHVCVRMCLCVSLSVHVCPMCVCVRLCVCVCVCALCTCVLRQLGKIQTWLPDIYWLDAPSPGRGQHSHAYTHSVQLDHRVFLNLETLRFYCLPDNYEIIDPSLEDIKV